MDIRNFFSPVNKSSKNGITSLSKEKKRKLTRIDSDEEDPIPSKSRKAQKLASDSDDDLFLISPKKECKQIKKVKNASPCSSNSKTLSKCDLIPKLKPASVKDFFGSSPVSQSKKPSKPKIETIDDDDDFTNTSQELDECPLSYSPCLSNNKRDKHQSTKGKLDFQPDSNKFKEKNHVQENKNSEDSFKSTEKNLHADKNLLNKTREKCLATKLASKIKAKKDEFEYSGKNSEPLSDKNKMVNSPKSPVKKSTVKSFEGKVTLKDISVKKSTPLKNSKSKIISSDVEFVKHEKENKVKEEEKSEILSTPEAERKKQNSFAYRKYLQRSGPRNHGGKPLPEGKPNCLFGLTFVLTGILETIDREETAELIKKYGGKVTTSISKNTSYLVVGEEAGESKLKKAEQLKTKLLNEDELFTLISSKSPSKDAVANSKVQTPKSSGNDPNASKLGQFQHDSSLKKKIKLSDNDSGVSSCSSGQDSLQSLSPPSKSSVSPLSEKNLFSSPGSSQISNSSSLSSQNNLSNSSLSLMWVDKYKPLSLKKVIGQYGPQSNANKLHRWLSSWFSNHTGDKKLAKPSPWSKDNTGAYFKAALLSGPPGIGKTTTAHLACKELEFDAVEMNASDTRSKRALSEDVSELLSNTSLVGFATGCSTSRNHVLIMDEVDGMAGNEDRGGIQEMIGLIKSSKIPIIFMCNDRNHPKIRSLANHCYDLRFSKPKIEQIRGAMMSVCAKEGIKIKPEALDQIIIGSNQDLRQVLHHLSLWSVSEKNIDLEQTTKDAKMAKKEFKLGPWDVVNKVFSESSKKGMSIHDKVSLFFHDYSIGPLFVQENYLKAVPHNAKGNTKILQLVAKTASILSDGDLIEKAIRKDSSWSLLPSQALFSSVLPGEYMSGHFNSQVEFPKWLGNNSRKNKIDRLAQELHTHLGLRISGNKQDVISDYGARICEAVIQPLAHKGSDGVKDSVFAMTSHDLIRDDLESLIELTTWPGMKDKMYGIDSKVKAAFTRALNKDSHLTPYSCGSAISKKKLKVSTNDEFDTMEDEAEEEGDQDDDDITKDAMIKPGKKTTAKKDSRGAPSTSKEKGGKSKGKK